MIPNDADAVLARRIANRDEGALEEAYERLAGIVYGLALRSLADPELAEACLQDVFATVWRNAARFDRSRGSLGAWVVALARNRVLDAARAPARRPTPAGEPAESIAALPAAQLDAIGLAYFHGLTRREIAIRLQVPPGTVESRLRLGLDRLAGRLAEAGMARCEHLDAMAALALGALSEPEAEAARRDADACEECGQALARHQRTVQWLEAALPRVVPPPLDTARLRPERRRAPARGLLVAAVAALVAVLLVVAVLRGNTGSQPLATIVPGNAGAGTHGEAKIVGPGRGGSYLVLDLQQVPQAPPGRHYEVWVLRRGARAMSPLGAFRPNGRRVTLRLVLPGDGPYDAVDVSVQRDGGPQLNSGVHLASGSFRSS